MNVSATLDRPAGWSLRKRLVAGIVAMLAVFSLVVGALSVLALHEFLVSKVDAQLTSAIGRSQDVAGRPHGREAPVEALLPGLGSGAVGVLTVDGIVVAAGYIAVNGDGEPLTEEQVLRITAMDQDAGPVTIDLGGTLDAYRFVSTTDAAGNEMIVGLPLAEAQEITGSLLVIVGVVGGLALLTAGILSAAAVRRALRPLERVADTAGRVAELPLSRGAVALPDRVPSEYADPDTEVGKVALSLNRMLDHVADALTARQQSEDQVRQFVADASHELRTPLAAIRGYSELTRRAPYELPDELRHSLSRIESESVRMSRLVEELLLLAHLDEGRALRAEPVDLGDLLADVASDARAAGPDHEWRVTVPDEPVVIRGDAERLHQAFANLLANSRVHTPAGTSVEVRLTATPDAAIVSVSDDGPGIAKSILPTLFERFVRGDSSRSRRAGSTGLGLSIVRAILEAHAGTVTVESEPGRTVFTARLPSTPTGSADRRDGAAVLSGS
ncbi:sensor histidine kinase [Lysobacter korlensis]|uniref:histidine kinase n=1 Tax=Lysobacter korlensis TaxID=553636 RepID=A0ABV6RXX3_9GAMM